MVMFVYILPADEEIGEMEKEISVLKEQGNLSGLVALEPPSSNHTVFGYYYTSSGVAIAIASIDNSGDLCTFYTNRTKTNTEINNCCSGDGTADPDCLAADCSTAEKN